jgi:alpha-beta hydrolase superfamily lysophospholipase
MKPPEPVVTNLELRESNPDGSQAAGLSHTAKGMFLLHVLELAAEGPPRGLVAVLHDAGEHGGRYVGMARTLAGAGWAVSLPDMRGHGESEGERGHSRGRLEILRDVADVLDHLAYMLPEGPRVLVGQGLGALQALVYALERPGELAGLVLVAPLALPRFEPPARKGGLLGMFAKTGPASAGRVGWRPDELCADPAEQARIASDRHCHGLITLGAAEAAGGYAAYLGRLGELEIPVLVLHGADDPIADPSASARLSGSRLEVKLLPGRRHWPLAGAGAGEAERAIVDWLSARIGR